jgi:hypothetical protein
MAYLLSDPAYDACLQQERLDAMKRHAQSLGMNLPDWVVENMAFKRQ